MQSHDRVTDEAVLAETSKYGPSNFLQMCSLLLKKRTFVFLFPFLGSTIPFSPANGVFSLRFIVDPLRQSLHKISVLHWARQTAHYKMFFPGISKNETGVNTWKVLWDTPWSCRSLQCGCFQNYFWCICHRQSMGRLSKSQTYVSLNLSLFPRFGLIGMVDEACFPSNVYFPRTPEDTLPLRDPCLFVRTFQFVNCHEFALWSHTS